MFRSSVALWLSASCSDDGAGSGSVGVVHPCGNGTRNISILRLMTLNFEYDALRCLAFVATLSRPSSGLKTLDCTLAIGPSAWTTAAMKSEKDHQSNGCDLRPMPSFSGLAAVPAAASNTPTSSIMPFMILHAEVQKSVD